MIGRYFVAGIPEPDRIAVKVCHSILMSFPAFIRFRHSTPKFIPLCKAAFSSDPLTRIGPTADRGRKLQTEDAAAHARPAPPPISAIGGSIFCGCELDRLKRSRCDSAVISRTRATNCRGVGVQILRLCEAETLNGAGRAARQRRSPMGVRAGVSASNAENGSI